MTDPPSELRPMTAAERERTEALLARALEDTRRKRRFWVPRMSCGCGVVLGVAALLVWRELAGWLGEGAVASPLGGAGSALLTGAALGVFLGAWLAWLESREQATELLHDLERGLVDARRFEVRGAARAPDLEDLAGGPVFFLDVGEGRLLALGGELLRAPYDAGGFPSRTLAVVRLPRASRTLSVACEGEPVPALEAPPLAALVSAYPFEGDHLLDGVELDGRLETLPQDLERRLGHGDDDDVPAEPRPEVGPLGG